MVILLRIICVISVFSSLFNAALWSPAWKGLTSWLLCVMFVVFLLPSHMVSLVRCRSWLYRFLIFAVFLTFWNILFSSANHFSCLKPITFVTLKWKSSTPSAWQSVIFVEALKSTSLMKIIEIFEKWENLYSSKPLRCTFINYYMLFCGNVK